MARRTIFPTLIRVERMYFDLMVISGAGNNFGHSLLNGARVLFPRLLGDITPILKPYAVFAVTVFAFISYLVVRREGELWRKVCLLVLCLDLLPYTSTDYKLIYLVLTAYLFINKPTVSSSDSYVAALFGLMVVPKAYFTFRGLPYNTVGIALTPALMFSLLVWLVATTPKVPRRIQDGSRPTSADTGTPAIAHLASGNPSA